MLDSLKGKDQGATTPINIENQHPNAKVLFIRICTNVIPQIHKKVMLLQKVILFEKVILLRKINFELKGNIFGAKIKKKITL